VYISNNYQYELFEIQDHFYCGPYHGECPQPAERDPGFNDVRHIQKSVILVADCANIEINAIIKNHVPIRLLTVRSASPEITETTATPAK